MPTLEGRLAAGTVHCEASVNKETRKTRSAAPSGQHRITRKRVAALKPAPENLLLYRKIKRRDPDNIALVKDIRQRGLHVPLIVTLDNVIVSGNRRHAALTWIGQVLAPCIVLNVRWIDLTQDERIQLLRSHNQQRNKSVAEQVREALVDADPGEAIRNLHQRREESINGYCSSNGVTRLRIEGASKRYRISNVKSEHVKHIKQIVFEDRRAYWPLSVRGIHYPLLNYDFFRNKQLNLKYCNDDCSYDATSNLLTRLRLNGEIPWEALTDGTRPVELFHPFQDVRHFIRQEVERLFAGYWRDRQQSQPNHVELLCEKNTVYHMALSVTRPYQITTSSGRGFSSIDPYHEIFERYQLSGKERLILIVLADYDPEGELIPHVAGRTLRDDFGVHDLEIIKAGVTRHQIEDYDLPAQNFAKESSSNRQWFVDRNGGDEAVYELEALDPTDMLRDLEDVITNVLDMDVYQREIEIENEEAVYLETAQRKAMNALRGLGE
jgi:hypothetical protein